MRKLFEGDMLITTLPTTPIQIFGKLIHSCPHTVRSIIDPDNMFRGTLGYEWVKPDLVLGCRMVLLPRLCYQIRFELTQKVSSGTLVLLAITL